MPRVLAVMTIGSLWPTAVGTPVRQICQVRRRRILSSAVSDLTAELERG